jgi:hypothetical protein
MHGVPLWLRSADVVAALVFMASVALGLLDQARVRLWALLISVAGASSIAFVWIAIAISLGSQP